MKTLKFFSKTVPLTLSFIIITSFSFAQWTNIAPSNNYSFYDISFPSQSVGFAIVDSASVYYIYKTQNTGTTWKRITPNLLPITGIEFQNIYFVDNNTGYILGNKGGSVCHVFKTTDGGATWVNKTPTIFPADLGNDIAFTDVNNGYVGIDGAIFKTTNGGDTWTKKTLPTPMFPCAIKEIDFYGNNNGIVGAWDLSFAYKGIIYTTTDAGVTWNSLVLKPDNSVITDVDYTTNSTAYASSGRKIYKTINNGLSWDTLALTFLKNGDVAMDINFINDKLGYLSTNDGYIFMTSDGGVTWNQDHFNPTYLDIIAYNGSSLFIGGLEKTLITKVLFSGIEDNNLLKKSIDFYPNPIGENETINFNTATSGLMQITDLTGRIIFKTQLKNETQFNLSKSNISPGIYVLSIMNDNVTHATLIIGIMDKKNGNFCSISSSGQKEWYLF